jgi:hypothetical protein
VLDPSRFGLKIRGTALVSLLISKVLPPMGCLVVNEDPLASKRPAIPPTCRTCETLESVLMQRDVS